MSWSFELALLIFLIISAISHYLVVKSQGVLSPPFVFGVLFMIGYGFKLIPQDFVQKTKLLDVGIIAYNVFIINAGTQLSFKTMGKQKKSLLLVCASYIALGLIIFPVGNLLFGKSIALFAFATIPGGGATSAIASFSAMRSSPQLSFFPWMMFMFQGFFSIPFFAYFVKKESLQLNITPSQKETSPFSFTKRAPYKQTAYYLAILMLFSVINKMLFSSFSNSSGIALTFTALLFGILIGNVGLIEQGPLHQADCFGLLMLGLMSLMAENLSHVPVAAILKMVVPALVLFSFSTIVLIATGVLLSKKFNYTKERAIAITLAVITAFPANKIVINSIFKDESSPETQLFIEQTNMGSIYGINIFSVALVSVLVVFI